MFQGKQNIVAENVDWKEECKDLLVILNQSEDSGPFREPIDILYVPDYLDTIAIPMDLQTVGGKLEADNYATPSEFAKDVRLIFANSKEFKPNRNSKIYGQTYRISFLFEEYFHNILTSYRDRKTSVQSK